MNKIEKDQVIIETLQSDVEIPNVVNNKLEDAYGKIRTDEVRMKGRKKKLFKGAWIAAAAACFVFVLGGVLYVNPALAKDIPILGDVFGQLQKIKENSLSPQKDKTAYENIEQHSKAVKSEPESGYTNMCESQGSTIGVTEAYCDGYDLYFTLSLNTKDEELKSSDSIDLLSYQGKDTKAYGSWLTINGVEAHADNSLTVNKVEDGVYAALVRVSAMSLPAGTLSENMSVELEVDVIAGHKVGEVSMMDGFKSVEGSWKLGFQPTMDTSSNKTAEINIEKNGVIIQDAAQTPSNMHLTVYLPAEYAIKNPAFVLMDIDGNRVYEESSKLTNQENGGQIRQVVLNHSDSAQFVLQILDKNAEIEEGASIPVLAEIPFSIE